MSRVVRVVTKFPLPTKAGLLHPTITINTSLRTLKTATTTSRPQVFRTKMAQTSEQKKNGPVRKLGISFGFGAVGFLTYHWTRTPVTFKESIPYQKSVHFYRKMPLRTVSRIWGKVNSIDLPTWLRKPALMLYIWLFGCNLQEAAIEDLTHYRNLGEFFRRQLKPNVRSIDSDHCVTSPADGKILHYGRVENGRLEQVKGVTYQLKSFLGLDDNVSSSGRSILMNKDNELYHCIIYLSPADYHRFHSPTSWIVEKRKHFPGDLLSVSPSIARIVQGLFNFNERAVYEGRWSHGYFSYTAVGATNVGSIKVYFDDQLKTNYGRFPEGVHFDRSFVDSHSHGVPMKKGEIVGEFNLGSTIVLVFEAPKDFKFKIENGQRIKVGEAIGKDLTFYDTSSDDD